jgi:hypothetical protein
MGIMMKIKLIIASSILAMLLTLGCGRSFGGTPEPEHCASLVGTPPAPSFVLEKVTDYDGWLLYERQELTPDSVFYLAIDVERGDTLDQWREARITEEEVMQQEHSVKGRIRMAWHDLYLLFEVNRRLFDET